MIWFVTSIQWGVLALAQVGNVLAANVRGLKSLELLWLGILLN